MSLNMRIGRKWISQNQFLSGFAFCSSLEFFLEVNINNNSSFSGESRVGVNSSLHLHHFKKSFVGSFEPAGC